MCNFISRFTWESLPAEGESVLLASSSSWLNYIDQAQRNIEHGGLYLGPKIIFFPDPLPLRKFMFLCPAIR
jgi:hypothetical protein